MRHDEMVERLRAIAATVDAPPPVVGAAARAALSMRRFDGELAELMLDSELAGTALVRDESDGVRLLSFETPTVSIELQIEDLGDRLVLRGLVSGASGDAVVETSGRPYTAPIDDRGWFTVDDLPRGAVRVRVVAHDGTPVTTSWASA